MPYSAAMAHIVVGGEKISFPDEEIEQLKQALKSIKPGGYHELETVDEDGDAVWVWIPFGAPVIINAWDHLQPHILPDFRPDTPTIPRHP